MVGIYLYVEGGGDARTSLNECRKGFRIFLEKAGFEGKMPRIVACGGRRQAYEQFCQKVKEAERYKDCFPLLLIDSECAVDTKYERGAMEEWNPWEFLKKSEGENWVCPEGASDSQCHFMVQCMESWILCDVQNLMSFYGQGFSPDSLPQNENIEMVDKQTIYSSITNATRNSRTKGSYNKGNHSFKLLETTDPRKVKEKSKWAARFIAEMEASIKNPNT